MHRSASILALLACATNVGCDEGCGSSPAEMVRQRALTEATSREPQTAPIEAIGSGGALPQATAAVSPTTPAVEGEASPTDLWDRVRRAVRTRGYRDTYACIHPETRRRYLEDLVADAALSSAETSYVDDLRERKRRAKMRNLLAVFGATANVEGKRISVDPIAKELLARVPNEGALFEALFLFADTEGAHLDPVGALTKPPTSAAASAELVDLTKRDAAFRNRGGFPRLLSLIDGAGELRELNMETDGATGFVARGATLYVVRFRKSGDRYFIDES